MMRLTIIALTGAALVGTTALLRSHQLPTELAGSAGMPTFADLQRAAGHKLPHVDFDDRSLVFPRRTEK